jgi:SAM-dependent methyltransferase
MTGGLGRFLGTLNLWPLRRQATKPLATGIESTRIVAGKASVGIKPSRSCHLNYSMHSASVTTLQVIDVGGGASPLVGHLLARGFTDLTVLDISHEVLQIARQQLMDGSKVSFIEGDLLSWVPTRRYDLWHDRAVFHFLVNADAVDTYRDVLDRALSPSGSVIIATFAPEGPDHCSGLPAARYCADSLAAALGKGFEVVVQREEVHTTLTNAVQCFTWIGARRIQSNDGSGQAV